MAGVISTFLPLLLPAPLTRHHVHFHPVQLAVQVAPATLVSVFPVTRIR